MPAISPARKAAFQILIAIEGGKSHADDLLHAESVTSLSPQDRNLATALVLGTLRWQIRLDHQIQAHLTRPNARLDTEVRIALRLGAFQLLHLDRIPSRAAIDESVELTKQAGHHYASRMVNAVLRKLSAAPLTEFPKDSAADLALAYAHPVWLVERWVRFLGFDAAKEICRHGQHQPDLTVRLAGTATRSELARQGIALEPGRLLVATHIVASGEITTTTAFREDRLRIQDEGSQLIAEVAGHGDAILDCCAAPGGKTLILAERSPEAHIIACEVSPRRFAHLRKRLESQAPRVECRLADVAALAESGLYDLVLVDVPCSGTGTLGRNPEIRHRVEPGDLPRHAERQRAILQAALRAARPGGHVVYSTCSLETEENEEVVAAVLASAANTRIASMPGRLDEMLKGGVLTPGGANHLRHCVTPEGFLRLTPGASGSDGFFIALLERSSAN